MIFSKEIVGKVGMTIGDKGHVAFRVSSTCQLLCRPVKASTSGPAWLDGTKKFSNSNGPPCTTCSNLGRYWWTQATTTFVSWPNNPYALFPTHNIQSALNLHEHLSLSHIRLWQSYLRQCVESFTKKTRYRTGTILFRCIRTLRRVVCLVRLPLCAKLPCLQRFAPYLNSVSTAVSARLQKLRRSLFSVAAVIPCRAYPQRDRQPHSIVIMATSASGQEQDILLQGLPALFSEPPASTNLDWSYLDLCADSASCVTDSAPVSTNTVPDQTAPETGTTGAASAAAPIGSTTALDPTLLFAAPDISPSLWQPQLQIETQGQGEQGEQAEHAQHGQHAQGHQQHQPQHQHEYHLQQQSAPLLPLHQSTQPSDHAAFPHFVGVSVGAHPTSVPSFPTDDLSAHQLPTSCVPLQQAARSSTAVGAQVLSPVSIMSVSSRPESGNQSSSGVPHSNGSSNYKQLNHPREHHVSHAPSTSKIPRKMKGTTVAAASTRRAFFTPGPTAGAQGPAGVSKSVTQPKQRRRYNQPRSSKYCHLCARHERAVVMVACGNLYRGLCQKSVCRKCFATYGLDWEAARASIAFATSNSASETTAPNDEDCSLSDVVSDADSASVTPKPWLCPHCVGTCPKRAKCFAYDRQTIRRRVKTQEARLNANDTVSVAL